MRVVATVQLKQCIAGASVFCIIIGEFSYWKEFCLIVLLKVDKNTEKSFHCIVLPLGLAVSLKVEDGRKPTFNA